MSLDTLKKIAIGMVIIYFGLKVLSMIVPALLSVLGLIIKIAFWLMIIVIILYLIGYILERNKK